MLPADKNRSFHCPARSVHPRRTVSLALLLRLMCTTPDVLAKETAPQRYEFALPRMGTLFQIEHHAGSEVEATRAATGAFERIEELEQVFGDYREDSELNCLAREGSAAPRPIRAKLFYLLDESLLFFRSSCGAFDVMIGPMIAVWRKAGRAGRRPGSAEVAQPRSTSRRTDHYLVIAGHHRASFLTPSYCSTTLPRICNPGTEFIPTV